MSDIKKEARYCSVMGRPCTCVPVCGPEVCMAGRAMSEAALFNNPPPRHDGQSATLRASPLLPPITNKPGAMVRDFSEVINRHSIENDSNTPDFLLARLLLKTLDSFAQITREREQWYGKPMSPGASPEPLVRVSVQPPATDAQARATMDLFHRSWSLAKNHGVPVAEATSQQSSYDKAAWQNVQFWLERRIARDREGDRA